MFLTNSPFLEPTKTQSMMNKTILAAAILISTLLLTTGSVLASQEVPGAEQKGPIALVEGTIHPVVGEPIERGVLVFDQGKITAIGRDVKIPRGAKRIKIRGKHVYPGMINALGSLGLIEINSVRATKDFAETGSINPNVRAEVAVNPDSELIPVTRSNGVLLSLTAPQGGLISGTSAVIQHDGWTWEDMALRAPVGMHVNWPRMAPLVGWDTQVSRKEQLGRRDRELKRLDRLFEDVRAYQKARRGAREKGGQPHGKDARLEAMLPVLNGKLPLVVWADRAEQIQSAVAFAVRQNVRLILAGGYDAARCAHLLKEHDVPVIVGGVLRAPERRGDPYDTPYTLPERLRKAGVRYCIAMGGRFSDSNMRNLPYHASTAAAHGLPRDEALKSVTIYAAEILGVADRVGSLEVGKDATLVVSDGDMLATPTHVEAAFVQGREVDLNNRQKRLWKKYEEKYRRQE